MFHRTELDDADLDEQALERQRRAPGDLERGTELIVREIHGERAVGHPHAGPVVVPRRLAMLAEPAVKTHVQVEQRGRRCRGEEDRDGWEQTHARERDRKRRGLGGECRQLGLEGGAGQGLPDAERDVRSGPRPRHVRDADGFQLAPEAANGGGRRRVEGELDGVGHRHGS